MKIKSNKTLGIISACGMALAAVAPIAAPVVYQGATLIHAAAIESNATYSVTLNKRLGSSEQVAGSAGTRNDGIHGPSDSTKGLNHNGQALDGIKYTLTQVKPTGAVADMKAPDATTYSVVEAGVTKTGLTDVAGQLTFDGLKKGYYLISETKQAGIETGDDFIVSLPMKDADGALLPNVNIWPKNHVDENGQNLNLDMLLSSADGQEVTTGEKSLDAAVGSTVTWNLTGHVPETVVNENAADDATKYGGYKIMDPIVSNLEFVEDSVVVTAGGVALDAADFVVTKGAKVTGHGHEFTPVTIELTNSGLKKAAGKDIKATISTKITSIAKDEKGTPLPINNTFSALADNAQAGISDVPSSTDPDVQVAINNALTADPTDPKNTNNLPVNPNSADNNQPVIKIGRVDLTNVASDDETVKLAGGEFTVYTDAEATKPLAFIKGMEGDFANADIAAGDPVVIKTDVNGLADLSGMKNGQTLYLKETKAPTDYNLTDEIFSVVAAQDTISDATIKNDQDVFSGALPITGGQLRVLLISIGSVMMLSSGAMLYIRKRKEVKNAD